MNDVCFVYAINANVECCGVAANRLLDVCRRLKNDRLLRVTSINRDQPPLLYASSRADVTSNYPLLIELNAKHLCRIWLMKH
jgi:hypothetical protein